ncbi:Os01g0664366 [Oryza sativa Japonica Group]|uniref:Os01g0664366 protein n=1 Tax=Oryza sativa subsp. japonica TaxID=39947 RepID=A0A0P0V6D8_ORYSJ|nr:Os01g0664366 [Oryza sativa Japonica Group]
MSDFDLDEESGLAPMRFTDDTAYTPPARALRFLCDMINVLAIRVIVPSYPDFDFGCVMTTTTMMCVSLPHELLDQWTTLI